MQGIREWDAGVTILRSEFACQLTSAWTHSRYHSTHNNEEIKEVADQLLIKFH